MNGTTWAIVIVGIIVLVLIIIGVIIIYNRGKKSGNPPSKLPVAPPAEAASLPTGSASHVRVGGAKENRPTFRMMLGRKA